MTQYLITHERTNPRFGWADLDAANVEHYASKAIPEWLTEAREATNRAQKALDEFYDHAGASTDWDTEQAQEFERLLAARNDALEWERDVTEINGRGEVPASILYTVQMREDAR